VAATVPGFIGFAVGRTSFWDAVASYESGKATREQASAQVAARYSEWVRIFEHHSAARGSHTFSNTKVKP
jgi:myo-inositol catabolism protein IolC